jgi:multiple sugar transport system permease protein
VSTATEPTRGRRPEGTSAVSQPVRVRALRSRTIRGADARWGLAMSVPTVCVLVLIVIIPAAWTILLAFQRVTLINIRTAGVSGPYSLANIEQVIRDPGFVSGILATLAYSVFGTVLSVALGLGAALALRKWFRGRGLVRVVLLLP